MNTPHSKNEHTAMIPRNLSYSTQKGIKLYPAVVILGPRQVGKTTLAKQCTTDLDPYYIDLEHPGTLENFQKHAEKYLHELSNRLVIIDEVQHFPELFMLLRGIIDHFIYEGRHNGHYILLGSASQDLLKQSESLAGRVSYLELTTISPIEAKDGHLKPSLKILWLRGGFPKSYLSKSDEDSYVWRKNLVTSYTKLDIPQAEFPLPASTLSRMLAMIASTHGEPLNVSKLAGSMNISVKIISLYIGVLEDLMLLRRLLPFAGGNSRKRLVKSPRIFFRDSGLLHYLLGIQDYLSLLRHIVFGKSWEGFVIESIINILPVHVFPFFYLSTSGEEIDLLLEVRAKAWIAIDITSGERANIAKGFHDACRDIQTPHKYLIYGGDHVFTTSQDTKVMPLLNFLEELPDLISRIDSETMPQKNS